MEIAALSVRNRNEWRQWLESHHRSAQECWIAVRRGRPSPSRDFWYLDAVEEALCFGWIDSTVKTGENGVPFQRFAPRKRGSRWSELNKERCRRLERLGLMTDAGRAVLPDMSPAGFSIEADIVSALQSAPYAWENFCSFPSLYQRVRVDTIQIKRRQPLLFQQRLRKLVDASARGILFGQWNDYGRLWAEGDQSS